ncbi:hypothetical protein [Actinoplanes utahensis]|uniref:hypothetical protein n=1 Tax=Actinoplanes utahensis TaxID=1869 RepID=UPI00126A4E06|nr:hypothetical protein [Actinoplanes utahensis]GIF35205.1 hypothetical protein Aut01nite_81910 [Actinoplanes utahensis]
MSYDDLISAVTERVDRLPPQRRAAVFWLAGAGLRAGLSAAEYAGWADWSRKASDLAIAFMVNGEVGAEVHAVWEQASASTEPEASQLLNSFVICLSGPLAVAIEPEKQVGAWIEHALFPIVEKVSLDLFEDVVFPDDDGMDDVISDGRFQKAYRYLILICRDLERGEKLSTALLNELLKGGETLGGVDSGDVRGK